MWAGLQSRIPTDPTEPQLGGPQADEGAAGNVCTTCLRSFPTRIGLGVHRAHEHPVEVNAAIDVNRIKKQWSDEEMRMMAAMEAEATRDQIRNLNQHLFGRIPNRTLEGIKGKRRQIAYREMVVEETNRLNSESAMNSLDAQESVIPNLTSTESGEVSVDNELNMIGSQTEQIRAAMEKQIAEVKKCERSGAAELVEIAEDALQGRAMDNDRISRWLKTTVVNIQVPKGPVLSKVAGYRGTRKQIRKQRYAAVQKMYKKDIGAAARMILNENDLVATKVPNKEAMFNFWTGIFDNGKDGENANVQEKVEKPSMKPIWSPITIEEIKEAKTSMEKAAGPDGISPKSWNAVNVHMRCLLYNIFMFYEAVPKELKVSRTVFLPKVEGGSEDPGEFRPLTICSVVLREFNKILAKRLTTYHEYDDRQTAYLPMDGVGINVSVLTAVISEARRKKSELHLAILDLIKAFNSVYHSALLETIAEVGCPKGFVNYIKDMYTNVETQLQFEGGGKMTFIRIGVYQGDPLSGPLFTLAYERALKALDRNIGFEIANARLNANAYSDDGVLMAMTVFGLQTNINKFVEALAKIGLKINPRKSSTLSLVPSGRDKKMKVVDDQQYNVDGVAMKTLSISDFWRYLGVPFGSKGPTSVTTTLSVDLERLTKGPLKPQQRLRLLKSFVIPKFQDKLVMTRTTAAGLKKMDGQIRSNVRKWLHLPHDLPIAYLYAPVKQGGLGIPCLQLWIPLMRLNRLRNVMKQGGDRITAVFNCDLYKSIIHSSKQALAALGKEDPVLTDYHLYWKRSLHKMVDGRDVRYSENHTSSTIMNSVRMDEITDEDFIHYNQIRTNSLPTRKLLARGRTRTTICRAGCRQIETLQHVVQQCERTHGGRLLRHNRAVNLLGEEFKRGRYAVDKEVVIRTAQSVHKPDIIMVKDNIAYVVDAQVVKCSDLENDHVVKVRKYSEDVELKDKIMAKYRVSEVNYEACTLSYKGVWSKKSVEGLKQLGVRKYCLFQIVTSVLRGTWFNWRTFNRVTTSFR